MLYLKTSYNKKINYIVLSFKNRKSYVYFKN